MEKWSTAGKVRDENVTRRMRCTYWISKATDTRRTHGHTHTHRICNTCCFSTARMVTRTLLNDALYTHCLSCLRLITYLLPYSMVQSPSWEANWFAACQEIPRISRNPKVHYRTHKITFIKFKSEITYTSHPLYDLNQTGCLGENILVKWRHFPPQQVDVTRRNRNYSYRRNWFLELGRG